MKNNKSIITDKDLLILQKLLEDGRKSSASISKEIDLGREIVNYRIKRLIKENLIVKFVPRINEKAMHYQEYIILLKLNLDDEVSKQKFAYDTIGNKYLIWTIKSDSGWDLIVRLYAASTDEFKKKLSEILEGFSSVLTNYYTIISSDEIKENEKEVISRELFQKEITKKDYSLIKEDSFSQVDDKDKEILNLLESDARVQYKEIAEKLDISADTVKYRIDKMKTLGVIENFTPILNFSKLGFYQYAMIVKFSFLNSNEELEFESTINTETSIIKAIKSMNSEEFFLNLIFDDENRINEFKDKIKEKFRNKIETIEIFKLD